MAVWQSANLPLDHSALLQTLESIQSIRVCVATPWCKNQASTSQFQPFVVHPPHKYIYDMYIYIWYMGILFYSDRKMMKTGHTSWQMEVSWNGGTPSSHPVYFDGFSMIFQYKLTSFWGSPMALETQNHGPRRPLPTLALRAQHREHQWPRKIGVPGGKIWYILQHFYYVCVVWNGGLVG